MKNIFYQFLFPIPSAFMIKKLHLSLRLKAIWDSVIASLVYSS